MKRLIIALSLWPLSVFANDWDALDQPQTVAIMRHALAPGTGDPQQVVLGDCTTQRNLDDRGREQARKTGEALRDRGVAFDQVLTSQWCRTRETAELLAVGPVTDAPALNSFFGDFSTQDSQTADLRALIAEVEGSLLLVTHQVNISAIAGRGTRSGEILVIRLTDGPAPAEVIGSILIDP